MLAMGKGRCHRGNRSVGGVRPQIFQNQRSPPRGLVRLVFNQPAPPGAFERPTMPKFMLILRGDITVDYSQFTPDDFAKILGCLLYTSRRV